MTPIRAIGTTIGLLSALAAAGLCSSWAQSITPRYEVDLGYPQPLPNRWVTGGIGGHCVDAQDHVLLLNSQDVLDGDINVGRLAPLMIELATSGKVVHSWGDPKLIEGTT